MFNFPRNLELFEHFYSELMSANIFQTDNGHRNLVNTDIVFSSKNFITENNDLNLSVLGGGNIFKEGWFL